MNKEEKIILNTRTKEALSSYISENYFFNNFNIDNIEHTTGWWASMTRDRKYLIFLVKESLNDLDYKVIEKVKSVVSGIFQLKPTASDIILEDLLQETPTTYSLEQFLKRWKHHNPEESTKHEEDFEIKERYWEYFINEGIASKVINQISIENTFLKKYFYSSNIDYILKNEIGFLLLEIKYKYPSKNRTYGINAMQYDIYSIFQKQGIMAYNIVLDNQDRLDILERRNRNQTWKYSRIKEDLTEKKSAPKKTSYDQKKTQKYYELPVSGYSLLDYNSNIFTLACPKCEGSLIMREGPYGKFLGCRNFPSCKGSLRL